MLEIRKMESDNVHTHDRRESQYHLALNKTTAASQVAAVGKNPSAKAGDARGMGSVPGSGVSPGGGHVSHSGILAWRIPWTEEPGGLQPTGSQRVRHDRSD